MTISNRFLLLAAIALGACQQPQSTTTTDTPAGIDTSLATATPQGHTPPAANVDTLTQQTEQLLQQKLRELYKDDLSKNLLDSLSRKFAFWEQDLNGDNQPEFFVKHFGGYFCGSGGCTILLLNHDGSLNTRFTVTNTPILVSEAQTQQWRNLLLQSGNTLHEVKYNGKAYPSNPSVQPKAKETPGAGTVKILDYPNNAFHESMF